MDRGECQIWGDLVLAAGNHASDCHRIRKGWDIQPASSPLQHRTKPQAAHWWSVACWFNFHRAAGVRLTTA